MGSTVRGSNPGGGRFSTPLQTGPGAHLASYTKGTGSFPSVKLPGRGIDHPPHLTPRLKKERAIPLLPLWAIVACYRVSVTFAFTCLPVKGSLYMVFKEDKMNLIKLIITTFWKNAFSAGTNRVFFLVLNFSLECSTYVHLRG